MKLFLINFLLMFLYSQTLLTENTKNEILTNYNWKFSTYFGGIKNDAFISIITYNNAVYIGGSISSSDLPFVTNIYGKRGSSDLVILKMNTEGKLIWVTVLGSLGDDYLFSIAIDSSGNIWGCGEARGNEFPATIDAFQRKYNNGGDGVVFKLDSTDGKLLYSTFLGGSAYEGLTHIVVNIDNTIWVTGRTRSTDFPITTDAAQKVLQEEYNTPLVRFSSDGRLLYSTFFGGTSIGAWVLGDVLDVNVNGEIIIGGYTNSSTLPTSASSFQKLNSKSFDSFLVKFDSTGKLIWCTYFGGNAADYGSQITVDQNNNIYLLNYTLSTDLPIKNSTMNNNLSGSMDIFLSVFDANGNYLYGSYFGGTDYEGFDYNGLNYIGGAISLTPNGNISILFKTRSNNLPTDLDTYKSDFETYLLILDKSFNRIFSTYIGGNGYDSAGDLIPLDDSTFAICGATNSNNFPTFEPIQNNLKGGYDGFVGILTRKPLMVNVKDSVPPTYTSSSDSCGIVKTIFVADTQNSLSGIQSIFPISLQNVSLNVVSKTSTTAKIVISLLDKLKFGYYKIEIKDNSNNTLIIEDTLFSNYSDLLTFSPADTFNFGSRQFFSTSCEKIWLCNKTTDTIILKTLALKQNIDFSIPPSELPIVLPPLDSTQITICFAPFHEQTSIYRDTLEIVDECFYKRIVFKAKIDTNYYFASSRCNTKVYGTSNFTAFVDKLVVERISSNQLLVRLNQTDNNSIEIEIFDILGRNIYKGNFPNGNALIDFPFEKNSMYLIRIYVSGGFSQLIFFTFD
ncbi:hypothetical protein D9V84_06595 [Bacteroidetes/Chlorobi group bacterium Naka2016]|jgi:hypothetical protein|nr:MAG: hypothetical protein D9V84_06595 [Bacteroidetes/Chlorobi group bacterium Naka2016]